MTLGSTLAKECDITVQGKQKQKIMVVENPLYLAENHPLYLAENL